MIVVREFINDYIGTISLFISICLSILTGAYGYYYINYYKYDKHASAIGLIEIPNFLTSNECDELIQYMETHPDEIIDSSVDKGWLYDKGSISKKDRISKQCWVSSRKLALIKRIQRLTCDYIDIPEYMQESLQIVKYYVGGFFKPHYDEKITLFHQYKRYCTLLIFLNDDFEGGETVFPHLNRTIIPVKGKAIFFKNMCPKSHRILWYSYHGGNTVKVGTKYIANLWIRYREI